MWCFTAGVTGVLPTEIFNQTARPAAYMIAGSMMWLNLFITGMIFPFLVVSVLQGSVLNKHTRQTNYKFSVLGNKNNLVIHHEVILRKGSLQERLKNNAKKEAEQAVLGG